MKFFLNIDNFLAEHLVDACDGVATFLQEDVFFGELLP